MINKIKNIIIKKNLEKNNYFDEDEMNNDVEFDFNQDLEINEPVRSPGWIRYQKKLNDK